MPCQLSLRGEVQLARKGKEEKRVQRKEKSRGITARAGTSCQVAAFWAL